MQPYLFPYIGYWQLINYVDTYVVYDDVNFIKGGWINRNYILANGKKTLLTLQLKKASPNRLINEIEVGDNQKKILKTIVQAYSKAPFFESVLPLVEEVFLLNEKNLAKFLFKTIQMVAAHLGIDTKIILSSQIDKDNSLKGHNKVLEICSKLGSQNYVNAIGGLDLYDDKIFQHKGVSLHFLKTLDFEYPQCKNEFVKYLSIIDVLMFNPLQKISQNFLQNCKLI